MNFNTNFKRQNLFRQVITLLCLALLLAAGWYWLNNRQQNDLSFLLPIYQNGQEIRPAAIISEDGQVLLPVRAIAQQNGWLCQQTQLDDDDKKQTETAGCGSMLLLKSAAATALQTPQAAVICWYGQGQQPASLGVWLVADNVGQLLSLSAPGRFYQDELYLPEDFFSAVFGLSLKLDENGRANLIAPSENAPTPQS